MVIIYYEGKVPRLIRGVGTYRNGRKKPDKYVKTIRYITSKADERERNARCEKNGALKAYHNTERAPSKSDAIAMIATVYNDRRFGRAKTNKIKAKTKVSQRLTDQYEEALKAEEEYKRQQKDLMVKIAKHGGVKRIKKKKHKKLPPPEIISQD